MNVAVAQLRSHSGSLEISTGSGGRLWHETLSNHKVSDEQTFTHFRLQLSPDGVDSTEIASDAVERSLLASICRRCTRHLAQAVLVSVLCADGRVYFLRLFMSNVTCAHATSTWVYSLRAHTTLDFLQYSTVPVTFYFRRELTRWGTATMVIVVGLQHWSLCYPHRRLPKVDTELFAIPTAI